MNDDERITNIHRYWFDQLDQHGMCSRKQHQLWFQSRAETDTHIQARYGPLVRAALAGRLDHWADGADGLVALVLLLDQFTRNSYRGTAQAFSGDGRALALVQNAVTSGVDRGMPTIHRVFLYIPYEHSEDLEMQEQGIKLFDQLLEDCNEPVRADVEDYRDYSVAHRDVIARFGRFPHRNNLLGRVSTAAEQQHLATHGGF